MCQPAGIAMNARPLCQLKMGVHMSPILQSGLAALADNIVRSIRRPEEATESPGWWWHLSISTLLCWAGQPVSWHKGRPPISYLRRGVIARSVQKWQQLTRANNKNKSEKGTGRRESQEFWQASGPWNSCLWGQVECSKTIRGQVQKWLFYKSWKLITLCPNLKYGSLYLPYIFVSEILLTLIVWNPRQNTV